MSVMIDKYVIKTEQIPKVLIYDNELQRHIVSVNTINAEHNTAIAEIILQELNTGKYEPVEDDTPIDTVSPAETDGNDGAVESTGDNDITGDTDNSANNEDLGNG